MTKKDIEGLTNAEFETFCTRLGVECLFAKCTRGVWEIVALTHAAREYHAAHPEMLEAVAQVLTRVAGAQS